MKNPKLTLSNFAFMYAGHGAYNVEYYTPSGRIYKARITDMTIIDRTKHAGDPTQADLRALRTVVKLTGNRVK